MHLRYFVSIDLHLSVAEICVLDEHGENAHYERHAITTRDEAPAFVAGLGRWRAEGRFVAVGCRKTPSASGE